MFSCYKCFTDEGALLEHIPKHKESKHLKAGSFLLIQRLTVAIPGAHMSLLREILHAIDVSGEAYDKARRPKRTRSATVSRLLYVLKIMLNYRPDFPELDQLGVGSWNGRGGDGVGNGSICPVPGIPDACVDSPHLATFGERYRIPIFPPPPFL
jgi:hypothetical protein